MLQAQDVAEAVPEKPEGLLLDRNDETQLLVNMEGGRMVVRVVDEMYEPIPGALLKGYGEVDPMGKKSERLIMRPNNEGDGLENLQFISKPHIFHVRLILFSTEDEDSKEVYTFMYNQNDVGADSETDDE